MGDNLKAMTRDELNDYAGECGIADAASYANKDELIAAIEAAQLAEEQMPDETEPLPGETFAIDEEGEQHPAGESGGERYRVLKAVTLEDGTTVMPGETVDLSGPAWPARRAQQLVEQKYLRPMG